MHRDTRIQELVGDAIIHREPCPDGGGEIIRQRNQPGGTACILYTCMCAAILSRHAHRGMSGASMSITTACHHYTMQQQQHTRLASNGARLGLGTASKFNALICYN